MADAMVALATVTLPNAQSTIDFQNITPVYTHLLLQFTAPISSAAASPTIRFNSDASVAYSALYYQGSNGGLTSGGSILERTSASFIGLTTNYAGDRSAFEVMIFNYSANKHTFLMSQRGAPFLLTGMAAAQYHSTNAVNRITFSDSTAIYPAGTKVTLFGIVS